MNKQMDFQSLVATAMTSPGLSHMRPVVEKELLHYDLLFTLDSNPLYRYSLYLAQGRAE